MESTSALIEGKILLSRKVGAVKCLDGNEFGNIKANIADNHIEKWLITCARIKTARGGTKFRMLCGIARIQRIEKFCDADYARKKKQSFCAMLDLHTIF